MLICLPTRGDAGPDDSVNDHFGSAPYFTLVDTETGDVKILSNVNEHHSHGTCHPMNQLTPYNIDCVICGSMGHRAIQMLRNSGITVYQSDRKNVGEIVEQAKRGELVEMDPAVACAGHGMRRPGGFGTRGGGGAGGGFSSGRCSGSSGRGPGGGNVTGGRGSNRPGNVGRARGSTRSGNVGGGRQGRTGSGGRGRRGRNR